MMQLTTRPLPRERVMTRRAKVSILVSTGVFMASLDLFIVNLAFPAMQADFAGSSLGGLSWVLSAYAIVFAAALVPAGRWFDRVGRKRGFLLGVGLFGLASAVCAAAPTLEVLVGARIAQALGAALLVPTSLGLMLPEFPPERRAVAVALWSAVGGVAAAVGPVLGGLLVELSWRWVFIVNVPIALAALVVGRTLLHEIRDPEPGPRPDLLGAVLLVAAIGLLTWAIVEAPDHGWGGSRTAGGLAASVVLLAAFAARSRRHPAPVVPPAIVTRPQFAWAGAMSLLFFVGFAVMLLNGVLLLTTLWDYSTVNAGLALAVGPVLATAFATQGGRLIQRFGVRPVAVTGAVLFGLSAMLANRSLDASPDYVTELLPSQVLGGIGVGLVLPSTANAAFSALPPALLSTGIAVFSVGRQVGSALGVALLVAVFATPQTPAELTTAVQHGYVLMATAALLAALLGTQLRARTPAAAPVPVPGDATGHPATAPATVAGLPAAAVASSTELPR